MDFLLDINFWVIVICSLIGSLKASIEFDAGKHCAVRGVDVLIGMVCGMALVHHFANQLSVGLSAMIAVLGGAGGALVLETIMSILPAISKKFIHKWVNKLLE